MRKVKITGLPKQAKGGTAPTSLYKQIAPSYMADSLSTKELKKKSTLGPVPEGMATLEAEKGETAFVPDVDGLPAHYMIGGKRHSQGGTPLNLPENSFIFSDTSGMKIKDPKVLEEFGMPKKKGGYTPADVAKRYDINKYREILADKTTDRMAKETAEKMISNYNVKLAKLALYQESKKGFPDGIPTVALPYMAMNAVQPQDVLPLKETQGPAMQGAEDEMEAASNPTEEQFEAQQTEPMARYGGIANKIKGNPLLKKVHAKLGGSQKRFKPESGIYMTMAEGGPVFTDGNGVQYSKNTSDIDIPAMFGYGGQTMYQDGGKVPNTPVDGSKPADNKIPEDKIKKIDDPTLAVGDYYKDTNGKVRKVTKIKATDKVVNKSLSGKENYKPKYGSVEEDVKKADAIMEDLEEKGFAKKDGNGGWTIYRGAAKTLSLADKDFLTGLSSYNKDDSGKSLGAPGFKIVSQSTYEDKSKKKQTNDGFYGYADPGMVEMRYWQARNPNGSIEDFEKMDDATKLQNRKDMLKFYNYSDDEIAKLGDKINDPAKLYTGDFISNKKTGLVKRNQEKFEASGYRSQLGDDFMFGLEHLDKYNMEMGPEGELVTDDCPEGMVKDPKTGECVAKDLDIPTNELETPKKPQMGPEWWLQDVIKTAGAAGDMARIKKRLPWAPKLNPVLMDPTFYDPTRELAATQEQYNIGAQGAAAYAPSQALNSRMSQMAGQGAKAAADILGRYNNLNVGQANQFSATKAQVLNQANATNAEISKGLFDATTIANQQYDNAKNQARQELRSSYIDAITNKEQAYALNQLYPNYQIDPSQGGRLYFNAGDELKPNEMGDNASVAAYKRLKDDPKMQGVPDNVLLQLVTGKGYTQQPQSESDSWLAAMQNITPGKAGLGPYYEQGPEDQGG
jgi:hypothetical protein